MPPVDRLRGVPMKAAVLLATASTFGIWLFAGYYFMNRVDDIERRTAEINARYMRAQDLLSTVRAQVLLASVFVRDALLDPNPGATDYHRQVEDVYVAVNQALDQYEPVLDSTAERERVERLRQQINDSRQTMHLVLGTDSSRWPREARDLLRTVVVPKRELVIRVSEEVQALNRTAFVEQQRQVAEVYGASQRRLWQLLGGALTASFAIGWFVVGYAGRLERSLKRQRIQDSRNARELQDLSAKLITAQEEERRSVARELHDEVGQVLTAIKVELAVAQRAIEARGESAHLLEDARSATEGALTTVRDLSHFLHPALLDDLGLPATVDWYLRGFSRRHGVHAELLQSNMSERLAPEIEASSYRIIQEALTNIAKHSRAGTCRVYLQRLPTTLLLTVEDDGVGFEERPRDSSAGLSGLGLIGIRERASHLGGTVGIESAPGCGTRITVELPARSRTASGERSDLPADALPENDEKAVVNG